MESQGAPSFLARGWSEYQEHRLAAALDSFQTALTACTPTDGPALHAEIHVALGKVLRDLNDYQAAVGSYRSAAELYRSTDDQLSAAHALRHAADILRKLDRADDAEPSILQAISIYRKQLAGGPAHDGQQPLELHLANALRVHALLKEQAGLNAEAIPLWVEARDLYRAAGVEAGVAESRAHLAKAANA